jgi:ATP-binding cassette, subfamily B, bacterial
MEPSPVPSAKRTIVQVACLFRPYRWHLAAVFVMVMASSTFSVVPLYLTRAVFDKALFPHSGHPNLTLLYELVGAMIGLTVVAETIGVAQAYLNTLVGQRVMRDLRNHLYERLQSMSLRFFTRTRTGEVQSRLQNDVAGVQSMLTNLATMTLSNTFVVVTTLVAMLALSWQLTLLSFAVVPPFVYVTNRVGELGFRISMQTQESLAELSAVTQETLSVSGILVARIFGRHREAVQRFSRENERLARLQVRQQMLGRAVMGLVQMFFGATPALVYLLAGHTHLSSGTLVAFTALQTRVLMPVSTSLQGFVELRGSLALFTRIFEYLSLQPEIVDPPSPRRISPHALHGHIAFERVWFAYEEPQWALHDVSFEAQPGQLVAVVGPSGAGKTTSTYLIPRLYDVTRGAVKIDGVDVRQYELESLAAAVGMVTQETYLFHTSIRENLLFARPDATDAELEAVAAAAAIHDRILELPDGYETVVGERGFRLSGGEKQRLAIARVLLKNPRLLILDEATSALDTASERLVQAALQPLLAERTTIAIAHRLSTIIGADVIVVLDHGRVIEQGTHEELLEREGLYASLYEHQFNSGLVEARCEDGIVLASGDVLRTRLDGDGDGGIDADGMPPMPPPLGVRIRG